MLYRLFTENQNYEQIKKLVANEFGCATIFKADGLWRQKYEHSLIIEIELNNPDADYRKIERLCYVIKKLNQQDKILVQQIESDSKLI